MAGFFQEEAELLRNPPQSYYMMQNFARVVLKGNQQANMLNFLNNFTVDDPLALAHELTHCVTGQTAVGQALFLSQFALNSQGEECLFAPNMVHRFDVGNYLLTPLLEGLALFVQFDHFPTIDMHIYWVDSIYFWLSGMAKETGESKNDDNTYNYIGRYRLSQAQQEKRQELLCSDLDSPSPYTTGYFIIKEIFYGIRSTTKSPLGTKGAFVNYIKEFLFNDYVLANLIVDTSLSMEEFITQFKNRLNERITFLMGNEAPYQFIRFVMMSSNPEDEQLYIPVDKKAQEKYAKNIESIVHAPFLAERGFKSYIDNEESSLSEIIVNRLNKLHFFHFIESSTSPEKISIKLANVLSGQNAVIGAEILEVESNTGYQLHSTGLGKLVAGFVFDYEELHFCFYIEAPTKAAYCGKPGLQNELTARALDNYVAKSSRYNDFYENKIVPHLNSSKEKALLMIDYQKIRSEIYTPFCETVKKDGILKPFLQKAIGLNYTTLPDAFANESDFKEYFFLSTILSMGEELSESLEVLDNLAKFLLQKKTIHLSKLVEKYKDFLYINDFYIMPLI